VLSIHEVTKMRIRNGDKIFIKLHKKLFFHCLDQIIINHNIYNVCQDLSFRFNINEGLGLLKLANTVLILINPSPSNVKALIFIQG
jgi:hypothetical protein